MNRLRQLIHEIHRRSLWQVLGIYVVASWAVLQVVDTLGGAWNLPDWFPSFAFALLLVGLPIVLATAFVQEGMSGSEAESPKPSVQAPGASGVFTWRNALGGGVLAFALWGVGAAGWVMFGAATREATGAGAVEASVAVMPCDDLSPQANQAPLAQGLAEGIINGLAQLPDLKVSGITSVIALSEQRADIGTVAETLDVATVLECGLQQAGEVIRIRSRLVEAASGSVMWSEQIDRPADNIFAIQDEVARAVTDRLQVVFAGESGAPLVAQGTSIPRAHEAYLRGRYLWNQRTEESLRNAISAFELAVSLDPEYAEAYAGLADAYLLVDVYTRDPARQEFARNLERGLAAARRAVSLAPDLGVAHTSLGHGLWSVGRWTEAEQEFELALELSPGYATAHQWYGLYLHSMGRPGEGVGHGRVARELDPISRVASGELSLILLGAGQTAAAITEARQATDLAPRWSDGWTTLARVLLADGRYGAAVEAWTQAEALAGVDDLGAARRAFDAVVRYHETGEPQSVPEYETDPYSMSLLRALGGRVDPAVGQLDLLVRAGAYGRAAATHMRFPWRDRLREDSRYGALLDEAGITW